MRVCSGGVCRGGVCVRVCRRGVCVRVCRGGCVTSSTNLQGGQLLLQFLSVGLQPVPLISTLEAAL